MSAHSNWETVLIKHCATVTVLSNGTPFSWKYVISLERQLSKGLDEAHVSTFLSLTYQLQSDRTVELKIKENTWLNLANVTKKKPVKKLSVIGVLHRCTEGTNCWEYLRHKSQEKLWGIFIKDLKSQSDTRTWQCVTLCDWIVKTAWKHQGERWYELSWVILDVNYSSVWMMLWQRRQAHLDLSPHLMDSVPS